MSELIHKIVVRKEEILNHTVSSVKSLFQKKLYNWIDEEYDKGWIIEVLRFDFYNKDSDTTQYCDVVYRAKNDPTHLELLERLERGL